MIVMISLVILCVLVHDNDRLKKTDKRAFYNSYLFIFLSALAEWLGVQFSGNENVPAVLLGIVKCCDYILTPLAGASFIGQMNIRNIWTKLLNGIIGFNIAFQIVSLFTGWMTVINEQNVYEHGRLYFLYVIEYLAIIVLLIVHFLIYGRNFRRQNRFSMYLIMFLILVGIICQELFGSEIRTAYIALAMGAALMYIHSTEFSQQESDEHILEQQKQINTDALTGMLSRHAYSQAVREYNEQLPDDLAAFSIDINGLKTVNDTMGHEAGDELICGAARCIESVFKGCGSCYRTGGDEFVVLARTDAKSAPGFIEEIKRQAAQWHGKIVPAISLSAGYAVLAENSVSTCEELIRIADEGMYAAKNEYYRVNDIERRKVGK